MGKSNKFDYTYRSSTGKKLGDIIGSAVQKEAQKVKKDAERLSHKQRKQSSEHSTASDATSHESTCTTHIVDLKAPGKGLGDDGVDAMAVGLELALNDGTSTASLALEDLNLSGNGLTVTSLARLATVIELAKYDLKTLNLADNAIKVETDDEAVHWETFLVSFKACHKLRRLDLSGNVALGARALEVLARVHSREPAVTPSRLDGEASIMSLRSDQAFGTNCEASEDDYQTTGFPDLTDPIDARMLGGRVIRRRSGLRSIPYITLQNIGMNDAGALWLSFVLEDHYYPTQLTDELNCTSTDSAIKAYQQDVHSKGLDWSDNSDLGKDGANLLEKVEALRRKNLLEPGDLDPGSVLEVSATVPGNQHERKSIDRRPSHSLLSHSRASIRSIRTSDGGEYEATEIESVRRKIQRHIIAQDGVDGIQLWKAALRLVTISRSLLAISSSSSLLSSSHGECGDDSSSTIDNSDVPLTPDPLFPTPISGLAHNPAPMTPSTLSAINFKLNAATLHNPFVPPIMSSLSSTTTNEPVIPLGDMTISSSASPLTPASRTNVSGYDRHIASVADDLHTLGLDVETSRFLDYQRIRLKRETFSPDTKRTTLSNTQGIVSLPLPVVMQIVMYVAPGNEWDVLSETQRRSAICHGMDRDTLKTEREWLRMTRSAQVWMLLDSILCLAYGDA